MEIADSAKSILSSTEDPKAAWEALDVTMWTLIG
jgi:hypothetical protein